MVVWTKVKTIEMVKKNGDLRSTLEVESLNFMLD